ncbi:MAG: glycosyltransferase family 4 protein [Chitinophagales bacterium]
MKKRILFITPYPFNSAGSQRFRFEQFLPILKSNNYNYKQVPFIDNATWKIMYLPGNSFKKLWGIIKGIFRRIYCLTIAPFYNIIFIHRESAPIGPPIVEWILSKAYRKKYIYDFDDAIWLQDISEVNKGFVQSLKSSPNKIAKIISYAGHVSAGNEYLSNYSKKYNSNVTIVPTIVDTDHHKRSSNYEKLHADKLCIGWTGTHTTLKHFESIVPTLKKLYSEYKNDIYFKLIVNVKADYPDLELTSTLWNKESEISQLSELDIGIMPLPDNKWANGKCGFKAIQYMALGIPCVASDVGVNNKIIDNSINGILINSNDEFYTALSSLINDRNKRITLGIAAREKIENSYSKNAIKKIFLSILNQVAN